MFNQCLFFHFESINNANFVYILTLLIDIEMLIQRTFKLLQNLPKMTVYRCFSKEKEEDYGVQFDEEQIRRKMQEIR